ncbi:MAG: 50S ribosomal protein L6 [bacterium]
MSRLGKLPIEIVAGVQVKIESGFIVVKGPKGELKQAMSDLVKVDIKEKEVLVSINDVNSKQQKAFWGLYRSLINNMVEGVTKGFEKKLEINGVGYKSNVSGRTLVLNVGYSHPIEFKLPEGINANVDGKIVTISGIDKQLVGETAAQIRKVRQPEPYKGKGIKYIDEVIRRKEGKSAAK